MTHKLRSSSLLFDCYCLVLVIFTLMLAPPTTAWAQASAKQGKTASFEKIPIPVMLRLLRAEDERRWDNDVSSLLSDNNPAVRSRAAIAAGRIGDERAVPALVLMLGSDHDLDVRAMAAFALGETESATAIEALVDELSPAKAQGSVRARIMEALGKIAAALPEAEPQRKSSGVAILGMLNFEYQYHTNPDRQILLLGLTAVLRARPEGAGKVIARMSFLSRSPCAS